MMQTKNPLNTTRKGECGFLRPRGLKNKVSWSDFTALYHRVNTLPASGSTSCATSESGGTSSVSSPSDTSRSDASVVNVLPVKAPGLHVYVPIRTQTLLLTRIQAIMEHACFRFAQEAMPVILEETKWSCPEAGELNAWTYHFKKHWEVLQQLDRCQGSGLVLTSFLYSAKQIRNIAVHRQPITVDHLFLLMTHAINFCICLDVPKALDTLREIRSSAETQVQKLEDCKKNIEQGLATASQETSMTRLELWACEQQEMQQACEKFEKKRRAIFKKVENLLLSKEVACFTLEDDEDEDEDDDDEE
ncbi:ubiquinol-cytochrome-c reductase cytochrome c1 [Fusarium subglutinans]|uniref:Ubiquinol-cytochrome-c reductase cytochrome c1 n=1 Tax=Gibberella subglutinans TaxID=42677 RepID=A0A8H5Q390_GIBSU|nr:ubiquinol-cytochrome-c reductase cytochrome c1 [Fusarium subglutinans]KAF5607363.1 ubiquinol-cytochrome-c reductase cytochrome c1 [Fusarium subglutinans]